MNAKDIKDRYKHRAKKGEKAINVEGMELNAHKIKIDYVPIHTLNAAVYNPRIMNNEQTEKLCKGISEFGFVDPVIVNTNGNVIVGGHQRCRAAQLLGMTEVPVAWVTLDPKKEKALNIALNRISGEWKEDELIELLKELNATEGFDISLTGFNEDELKALLGEEKEDTLGEEDPEVTEVEEPFVKMGDLWELGQSRLLVGDSTNIADVERLIAGQPVDCVWSDPPYNIAYETKAGKIDNDNLSEADFKDFLLKAFASMAHALKPGACFYIAHAEGGGVGDAFRSAICNTKGLMWKQCLIWVKNAAVLARSDYNNKHEPILYGWKEGAAHFFNGDFTQTTVIDDDIDISKMDKKQLQQILNDLRNAIPSTVIRIDKPSKSEIHPTMKPVRLVERNLNASTRPGDTVLDLFSGSGTTIITCRKIGRKGRGMEFSPGYAQASLKRYLDYCHEEPLLVEGDKRTPFSIVEQQRKKK